jgi:hypothetical protein
MAGRFERMMAGLLGQLLDCRDSLVGFRSASSSPSDLLGAFRTTLLRVARPYTGRVASWPEVGH